MVNPRVLCPGGRRLSLLLVAAENAQTWAKALSLCNGGERSARVLPLASFYGGEGASKPAAVPYLVPWALGEGVPSVLGTSEWTLRAAIPKQGG